MYGIEKLSPIDVEAKAADDIDEDEVKLETQEAYDDLLTIFLAYSKVMYIEPEKWRVNADMALRRAESLLIMAEEGYKIDFLSYAKELEDIKKQLIEDLELITDEQEREKKEEEIAEMEWRENIIDNQINFAVFGNYTMLNTISQDVEKFGTYEEFEDYGRKIVSLYGLTYAGVENGVVAHGTAVAKDWRSVGDDVVLTYRNPVDERSRVSHAALDGVSYRKSEWPSDLSVPRDFGCRCWIENNGGSVDGRKLTGSRKGIDEAIKESSNPAFSSIIGDSGVVFGKKHSYFTQIDKDDVAEIQKTIKSVRESLGLPN